MPRLPLETGEDLRNTLRNIPKYPLYYPSLTFFSSQQFGGDTCHRHHKPSERFRRLNQSLPETLPPASFLGLSDRRGNPRLLPASPLIPEEGGFTPNPAGTSDLHWNIPSPGDARPTTKGEVSSLPLPVQLRRQQHLDLRPPTPKSDRGLRSQLRNRPSHR